MSASNLAPKPNTASLEDDWILKLGVISDVQYCPIPDSMNFHKTRTRYYRNATVQLRDTLVRFDAAQYNHVLHLGDLVDGKCLNVECADKTRPPAKNGPGSNLCVDQTFAELKAHFDRHRPRLNYYHVIGNHEMYCFGRDQLMRNLFYEAWWRANEKDEKKRAARMKNLNEYRPCYYRIDVPFQPRSPPPSPQTAGASAAKPVLSGAAAASSPKPLAIIVLDCYDRSVIQFSTNAALTPDMMRVPESQTLLKLHNPGPDLNDNAQCAPEHKQYMEYNGGVSEAQLSWLDTQLRQCQEAGQFAIVLGHVPVHPDLAKPATGNPLLWNWFEVMSVLRNYGSSVVRMYLCGHTHIAVSTIDEASGIPFVLAEGVVETAPQHAAELYLDVGGRGGIHLHKSQFLHEISLPPPVSPAPGAKPPANTASAAAKPAPPAAKK